MNTGEQGQAGISGTGNVFGNQNAVNVNSVTPTPPGISSLHQLPSPPPDFVGRECELRELREGMTSGGVAISGLAGMGGVGKTALALKLADELAAHYPDAGLYLDLRGVGAEPVSVADALRHFIRAFEPTAQLPDDVTQLRGIYLSLLHKKRAPVLLDNARGATQVEPLLPPLSCAVIVTSRRRFTVPGLVPQHLDKLPPADACALLLKIAPRIGDCAAEMARVLDYLPLALRLAASALAQRINLTPEAYLCRLADARTRLAMIESSIQLSYDLLNTALQACWRALAVFPDTFVDAGAAAVWTVDADAATDALGDLLAFSMLEWNEASRRYSLHDLTRDFAAARLNENEAECYAARKCHAAYYLTVLSVADRLFRAGQASTLRGLKLFDEERANIEAGQSWAATHAAQDEEAVRLCMAYSYDGAYVLNMRQPPHARIVWSEAALAAARQLQERQQEGNALGNLGIAYRRLGAARRALECHEQHLTITREVGDRRGEGAALANLGNTAAALGETRRALEYHEQSLNIAREVGDRHGEGGALGNLGIAYRHLGETRCALEFHRQALDVFREIGDHPGEGDELWNMSLALDTLGERKRAIELAEAALRIYEKIEDPWAVEVRRKLGEWRGEAEQAE